MDSMDRSILKCLSENSRRSATDISQAVHLSVAAVIERIRKMERKGIIQQYTIVADQHKLGNDVTALMEVSLEHPKYYDEFTKFSCNFYNYSIANIIGIASVYSKSNRYTKFTNFI